MKRLIPLVLTIALLAVSVVVAAPASAQQPNPKTLPGAKTVTFKLIIDGSVRAVGKRTFTNALLGFCKVNGSDVIYENTDFGRGKGVYMEFVRYKQHGHTRYAVQRVGRNRDSSFAVVYKLKRRALGQTQVTPAFPPAPCLGIQGEDFSKNPDCGKAFSGTSNWGFRLTGNTFSIAPLRNNTRQISDCGKSTYFGGLEALRWQWPAPALFGFEPLPLAKVFGHASAFKETLIQSNPTQSQNGWQGIMTRYEEGGPGDATVRFVRVPNAP